MKRSAGGHSILKKSIKKAFREILGHEGFRVEPSILEVYSFDASGLRGEALAVCFPRTTEETSKLMRLSYEAGIPVYARGAGSGRTGGAVPMPPGIVVSFERMNSIQDISREDLVAEVEPGVITGRLQNDVEDLGLFYPPDPASLSFCTIGGNVATCAGGPRAVKYGVTRDYILGVQAVLASGDVVEAGKRTVKGASGYSLKDLFCGSEGTLGLFTRLILKLVPRPEYRGVMVAGFRDQEACGHAILEIFSRGITPCTCEFMDQTCAALVLKGTSIGLPGDDRVGAMLLVESDGSFPRVKDELDIMEGAVRRAGAVFTKVAPRGKEEELWELRRTLSQRVRNLGFPDKVSEDIVVPRGRIPEILKRLEAIEASYGLKIVSFGHLGDGNIHVNVLYDQGKDGALLGDVIDAIFRETLELGGRVSGEHGIGLTKRRYLTWELSPVTYRTMKSVKDCLDPKGILNPHKVFLS